MPEDLQRPPTGTLLGAPLGGRVCDVPVLHRKRKEDAAEICELLQHSQPRRPSSVGGLPSPLHTDGTVCFPGRVPGGISGGLPWAWLPPHCGEVNKPRLPELGRNGESTTDSHLARERTVSLPSLSLTSPRSELWGPQEEKGGTGQFGWGTLLSSCAQEVALAILVT